MKVMMCIGESDCDVYFCDVSMKDVVELLNDDDEKKIEKLEYDGVLSLVEEEEKWKDWFEEEKDNGKVVDLKEFVDILKKLKF